MGNLQGKTALVTGGGRGVGRAIALALADAGADVIINYFRNRKPAEEVAAAVSERGRRGHVIKANVGDEAKVDAMFNEIRDTFGGLDILVSNAASGVLKPTEEIGAKEWDWAMNINARALLLCANRAAPLMESRGGGAVVSISSVGSVRVLPYYTTVGVSKAALEAATRYLAVALAPKNIVVNAVSPGAMVTDALTHFPNRAQILDESRERAPAGRLITTDEVAQIVLFLCSPAARMICGETIMADGGLSLLAFG